MKQVDFEIRGNRSLAPGVFALSLAGDTSAISAPGQFVNVKLEGFPLRRPISVCDWGEGSLTLIYKIQGKGTAALAAYPAGKRLDILTGLGNGYDTGKSGQAPLLVGGGVGTPPLYALAKRLAGEGKRPAAILGFNNAQEIFLRERFEALGIPVTVCTADGSSGVPGFVTAGMERAGDYSYVYTCGPRPMLRAVYDHAKTSGQFSFEERMGCGFGACMGCTCETARGPKRLCREGPVLEKEEIKW